MATPVPPVLPGEFCAAVPKAGEKLCTQVGKALIQFPLLMCRFFSWMMNPDGTPSDDFKLWVGTVTASADMPAPTNVTASNEFTDKVTVTWTGNTLAHSYEVWRGGSSNPLDSSWAKLGDITSTPYTDVSGTPGQLYYYAVKSSDGTRVSVFSNTDDGLRKTGSDPTPGVSDTYILTNPNEQPAITVPAGKTLMEAYIFGGGGNGGDSMYEPSWSAVGAGGVVLRSGGGGASAAYAHLVGYPVAANEVWHGAVGAAGGGTSNLSKDIAPDSVFFRVFGGGNGGTGTNIKNSTPGVAVVPGGEKGGGATLGTWTVFDGANGNSDFTGALIDPVTIGGITYDAVGDGGDGAPGGPGTGSAGQGARGKKGMIYIHFT